MTDNREQKLKDACVEMPETVFMMGANMEHLPEFLAKANEEKGLSIGNILHATPPRFVYLPKFYIQNRMVTNADYLKFVSDAEYYESYDFWRAVWLDSGFKLTSVETPYEVHIGNSMRIRRQREDYSECTTFGEAYFDSIWYEVARALDATEGMEEVGEPPNAESREDVLDRLMAWVKCIVHQAIVPDPRALKTMVMKPGQFDKMWKYYMKRGVWQENILNDIEYIAHQLRVFYISNGADANILTRLHRKRPIGDALKFLDRLRRITERITTPQPRDVRFSQLIYPREWVAYPNMPPTESPEDGGGFNPSSQEGLRSLNVSARDLPVTGITLYEALGYCFWLTQLSGGGSLVTLPSEAEYERASSWPATEYETNEDGDIVVDPSRKSLLPWQEEREDEFNDYFGSANKTFEGYYYPRKKRWEDLLLKTSRRVGESGERLFQLEGFGWCWTRDRHDDDEEKYSRFGDAGIMDPYEENSVVFAEGTKLTADLRSQLQDDGTVVTYEYEPNSAPHCSFFALKGSPELLGGPGLTTRRYAAYPLRGYTNIGFRFVIVE